MGRRADFGRGVVVAESASAGVEVGGVERGWRNEVEGGFMKWAMGEVGGGG